MVFVRCLFGANGECVYDIDPTEPFENVMVLIEVESGIPVAHQRCSFVHPASKQEVPLHPSRTLGQQCPQLGAEVVVHVRQVPLPPAVADPNNLIHQLFSGAASNPPVVGSRSQPPPAELISQLFAGSSVPASVSQQPIPDENDPDVQAKLFEAIQKKNLQENLEHAIEFTPEAFARVVMLYVPCTVNKVPLTAFVDSGAQMSVMSERMAEKCGIMRLLDRRMSGVAKGVGTCKILGKVHMTLVTLGNLHLPFSITVLERQDMDFLIGLDQLKRHQMVIDLKENALKIGDVSIPFLGEGDLPDHLKAETRGEGGAQDAEVEGGVSTEPTVHKNEAAPPDALDSERAGMIKRLMELTGLPKEAVTIALEAAQWSEAGAASLLYDN